MPIRKRQSGNQRAGKSRGKTSEHIQDLTIQIAAYRNRLNDALGLLEGIDYLRSVQRQIAEVLACIEESIVWFSDYFEKRGDKGDLLTNLKIYGAPALREQLNYLGTPEPDRDDLVGPLSELDEDPVASSSRRRKGYYPPGMVNSILDDAPDDCEQESALALIAEHLIDQIRTAGSKLHSELTDLVS